MREHVAAVRDLEHPLDVLLDDEDAGPALGGEPPDHREQVVEHDRGQAERELVEQQQLLAADQHPGQRQHLLLAAREQAGPAVVQLSQSAGSSA